MIGLKKPAMPARLTGMNSNRFLPWLSKNAKMKVIERQCKD
jgi:hypothetical protein